jgi:hypothetical protein
MSDFITTTTTKTEPVIKPPKKEESSSGVFILFLVILGFLFYFYSPYSPKNRVTTEVQTITNSQLPLQDSSTLSVTNKNYQNSSFPKFKLVHPEDWKFTTSSVPLPIDPRLLTHTITLEKRGVIMQIVTEVKNKNQVCDNNPNLHSTLLFATSDGINAYKINDTRVILKRVTTNDCEVDNSLFSAFKKVDFADLQQNNNEDNILYSFNIDVNTMNITGVWDYESEIQRIIEYSSFR